MKRIAILSIFTLVSTFSCTEPTEDITQQVNKDAQIISNVVIGHYIDFSIILKHTQV